MTMHNFSDDTSDFTPLADKFSDRRRDSPLPVLLELVKKVHEGQKELDKKLSNHMLSETAELKILLSQAFPDGDAGKHLAYHESLIEKAKEQAEFWKEMRLAAGRWFGIGVLTFLAGAVLVALKAKLAA